MNPVEFPSPREACAPSLAMWNMGAAFLEEKEIFKRVLMQEHAMRAMKILKPREIFL
jgi:hypothetical protein